MLLRHTGRGILVQTLDMRTFHGIYTSIRLSSQILFPILEPMASIIMTSFKRIVFISGANSGIGWEATKALLQSDRVYQALLGARCLEKEDVTLAALEEAAIEPSSTVELVQVDVSSDDSISNALEKVQAAHERIDV